MSTAQISESQNQKIRECSRKYFPEDLNALDSSQKLLQMIAEAVPSVDLYIISAGWNCWDSVERGETELKDVINLCAAEINNVIAITEESELVPDTASEESLLKAWVGLNYYIESGNQDFTDHMCRARDYIAGILINSKGSEDAPATETDNTLQEAVSPPNKKESNGKHRRYGKKKLLIALLLSAVFAILAFVLTAVPRMEFVINQIGDVTYTEQCAQRIQKAEQQYEKLSKASKEKLSNYDILIAARKQYDRLVTEAAIDVIGTVTLESQEQILHAQQLYESLYASERDLVSNRKILIDAVAEHRRLVEALENARKVIDAIGEVSLEKEENVLAARKAYDALEKDGLWPYIADKSDTLRKAEDALGKCIYSYGAELYEAGQYDVAIDQLAKVLQYYPDSNSAMKAQELTADCQIAWADIFCDQGDTYNATVLMKEVNEKYHTKIEYQSLIEKIEKILQKNKPNSGRILRNTTNWGVCEFAIRAGTEDILVKIQDIYHPERYQLVFIRAEEAAWVKMAEGTYKVLFATGEKWYDSGFNYDRLFGDDTFYAESDRLYSFGNRIIFIISDGIPEKTYGHRVSLRLDRNNENVTEISASEFITTDAKGSKRNAS